MLNRNLPGLLLASIALLLSGCVTHISTNVYQNPPPAEKFSNFNRIEVTPAKLVPPYAGQATNEAARRKIQQNIDARLDANLHTWNAGPLPVHPRTLRAEITIPEIKFISGGHRFWGWWYAGSSAVKIHARITEKETGRVIAEPEFYARAAAMGGAFTFGGTDNAMLVRIANRLTDYLLANYSAAVGGPTGAEPPDEK